MIERKLRTVIEVILKELNVDVEDFMLEHPSDMEHGDFATNVAMVAAKKASTNPRELAEEITSKLREKEMEEVEKIEVAGPGFINFTLTKEYFLDEIKTILRDASYGTTEQLRGKTIMVEYTQPNPFKVFHIGHLMSNAIGESFTRIFEASGATVIRANYQGDVGLHVAKAIWGVRDLNLPGEWVDEWGKGYVHGNAQYEKSEEVKHEIHLINKQVYEQDEEVMGEYRKGRKLSLEVFELIYQLLGTKFDTYYFESQTWERGKKLVEEGLSKGVFEESEGAIVYRGEKKGLHTRVFITKEGVTTYEAKDLGLAALKAEEFNFDTSMTVTAVEQKGYFEVVFAALEELRPELRGKFTHVSHGMMQFAEGKMSSRKGNVITGESMLNDAVKDAYEKMALDMDEGDRKDRAWKVAVAAIKYSVLKQSVGKNIIYDKKQALSFEGDSGPYLQYTDVRARSILEKSEKAPNLEARLPSEVGELEKTLVRFPEVVERAGRELAPHYLVHYLTELASAFNTFYGNTKIIGSECEEYYLALTQAVSNVLQNGLNTLGIKTVERM